MKKTLLLIVIITLGFTSQAQQLDKVHFSLGDRGDEGKSIIRDNDGHFYVFGHTYDGINVDFLAGGDTVNKHHAFLAKYDTALNLLWMKSFGGSGSNSSNRAYAWKALMMPDGNILLGGMFRGKVDFNPDPGFHLKTSKDFQGDIFLSKMDTSGKLIKNIVFQGDGWDDMYPWNLYVDKDSGVYVSANFTNNVDLDPGVGQQIQTTSGKDMFFVCLSTDLTYRWHLRFNDNHNLSFKPIFNADKTILLSGNYKNTIDLDPGPGKVEVSAPAGFLGRIMIEYGHDGSYKKHFDPFPDSDATVNNLWVNKIDDYYFFPGNFEDSMDLTPDKNGGKAQAEGSVSFMVKTDSAFNVLNIYHTEKGRAVFREVYKTNSYYYVVGRIGDTKVTDFDPGPDSFFVPKFWGNSDVLLLRLDTQLSFSWAGSTNSGAINDNSWLFDNNTAYFCGEINDVGSGQDFDLTSGGYAINKMGICIAKYNLCSPSYYTASDEDLCEGSMRRFGRLDITGAGTYTQAFLTNEVCDSVVNLSISIKPRSYHSFAQEACEGEEFAFAGILPWNTGLYYDTLQSFNGCDSIIELQFTRKSIDSTVTANAGVLLANATGHNYRWLDCNNQMQPIFGETNREFTPSKNGQYAVEVSANNCADTSHCIEVSGVGMAEHALGMYKVYPNPAGDNVFIETKGENLFIILNDITGKPVMKEITGSQTFSLDISDLAPGTYYLEIEGPEAKERVKIIKR